ncbi:MAG: S9 family peptidase, partial [Candidatus Saccharimonas sp.]|nr:S9 family peptidase [Planctomycetaceae bacterium]
MMLHLRRLTFAACLLAGPFALTWTARAEESDPRRPAAIEAKEVPVVPAEVFARLAQYQSVRGASFRGFAPDGTGLLIGTRFGNSSQLHRVYEPGGRREQITFYDEPVSGGFLPKATDGAILMLMDAGGNENDQVYLLDRRKFATMRLTDGKSRNKLGAVRPDGSQIVVTSNQRNGRDVDLYVADPRTPSSMKLVMPVDKQTWNVHDWSQDGKTLLLNRYVSANESYPALLDVASGQRTDLPSPTKEKAAFGPMVFAADGKSVFIATDANGEFHRLARLDLASKKYTWLTDDIAWDVSNLSVEPTSGDVAFTVNEDGASRLYLLPKGNGPRRELKLPLGIVSGLEFSPDGKRLGFTLARPDSPPDAYSLSRSNGELTRWTFSEVGGLNPESFVSPSRIQFKSIDGRMIPAWYFQPRVASTSKKVPVLISIHGGP